MVPHPDQRNDTIADLATEKIIPHKRKGYDIMPDFDKAVTAGQWEYNFVEDKVFITGGVEHDVQIALNAQEAFALLEFLSQHKAELSRLMHADGGEMQEGQPS
jgi:hypothetical protein